MPKATPFTAYTMMVLFIEKKVNLTESEFYTYWDQIVDVLERANNEKYRVEPVPQVNNPEG